MKLSKTSLVILCAGIFVMAIGFLVFTRSQQLDEQTRLDDELKVAEMRLDKLQVKQLNDQEAELQAQLDESILQLEAASAELDQSIVSADVTEKFFDIAQSCGVEVTTVNSSKIREDKLGEVNCLTVTLNAVAKGSLSNLVNFVIKLNNDFSNGQVNSARMSIADDSTDETSSVSVSVAVYTYMGS